MGVEGLVLDRQKRRNELEETERGRKILFEFPDSLT